MASQQPMARWQLRLEPDEDDRAQKLADRRRVSKNDLVRTALRLFLRIETEVEAGARLLIERPGKGRAVEVWTLG